MVAGLEQRVAERTEALEQRAAELAVINSVQQGLAAQLDEAAIYELVGDKIRDIFDAQAVIISSFDQGDGLNHLRYNIEKGVRIQSEPFPISGLVQHLIDTGQPLLIESDFMARAEALGGSHTVADTAETRSAVFVPLKTQGRVTGGTQPAKRRPRVCLRPGRCAPAEHAGRQPERGAGKRAPVRRNPPPAG